MRHEPAVNDVKRGWREMAHATEAMIILAVIAMGLLIVYYREQPRKSKSLVP